MRANGGGGEGGLGEEKLGRKGGNILFFGFSGAGFQMIIALSTSLPAAF